MVYALHAVARPIPHIIMSSNHYPSARSPRSGVIFDGHLFLSYRAWLLVVLLSGDPCVERSSTSIPLQLNQASMPNGPSLDSIYPDKCKIR